MPIIRNLEDVKRLFDSMPVQFLGVGVSAYMRIIPAFFIKNYRVLAFKDTRDLRRLEKYVPVFCLEREMAGQELPERDEVNTIYFLEHPRVQEYLKALDKEICLIVYQSYPEVEELSRKFGWRIVGNPTTIREPVENKKSFREILKRLGLPLIPGCNVPLKELNLALFRRFRTQYGPTLVFQLPDIPKGGGRGTFYLDHDQDFLDFMQAVDQGHYRGYRIRSVNVTRFMPGVPSSVAVCLTRCGTLFSPLQTQILDVPNVISVHRGQGVFCGHSWGYHHFPAALNRQAQEIAGRLADYLRGQGYRGIFGIDFIANEQEGYVYPVECNARYTGAFPMLSLLHLKNGMIPLDAFHILEFLDTDYRIDVERINQDYCRHMSGSHIILFNKMNMPLKVNGDLKSGLYRFYPDRNHIDYLGEGLGFEDMMSEDDFIVTDGVPYTGQVVPSRDEFTRICRILFPYPIAESPNHLKPRVLTIIDHVYDRLDLRPVLDSLKTPFRS